MILGRLVRYTEAGIEYEAGPKHRKMVMEYCLEKMVVYLYQKAEKEYFSLFVVVECISMLLMV